MSPQPRAKKQQKDSGGGITAIAIRGYKSLAEECSIGIRPLTILAGSNSSGKSSAMQPLLLLKQTLEATYDPGALLINGPNVRLTSAEQLLSKLANKLPTDNFTISMEIGNIQSLTSTFKKQSGIELVKMTFQDQHGSITLQPEMSHDEITAVFPKGIKDFYDRLLKRVPESGRRQWEVRRQRCFLSVSLGSDERMDMTLFNPLFILSSPFEARLRRLIHVPGLRGNPERTYKTTSISSEFPGTFEQYVASVINHWQATKDSRLGELSSALETLGLTWKVVAKQIDDAHVELRVGRLPHRAKGGAADMVSIADVGFGVSQILPVLVALYTAEPDQLVYLEEPELHLHPRAQVALAQVLADAANRGVRIVAETHSAHLLLTVQSLAAERSLAPEKVKLHWFKRRNDGVTEVTSADLDEAGAFGDWPEDFADVDFEVQRRYLDAAEQHQWNR